jgi:hypothetical protein
MVVCRDYYCSSCGDYPFLFEQESSPLAKRNVEEPSEVVPATTEDVDAKGFKVHVHKNECQKVEYSSMLYS